MDKVKIIGYLYQGNILDIQQYNKYHQNSNVTAIENNSVLGMQIIRHSMAHLLAHAITILFPNVEFAKGPVTDHGFFYDVHLDHEFTDKDLIKIQKEMFKLIDQKIPIEYSTHSRSELYEIFKNDHLKTKIIDNIPKNVVLSTYKQDIFIDLCKGPHVLNTNDIPKAFKLTHVEKVDKIIQRIHGVGFFSSDELKKYLNRNRDHRQIIQEMNLASFNTLCPAMVFWKQNGIELIEKLTTIISGKTRDFMEVITPPMASRELWQKTGHLSEYKENMFFIEDNELSLKPMNCPLHCLVFKEKTRSYKDLPIRISEFGKVFRNEFNGGLIGLKRLQHFTQDDGHIFCTMAQVNEEIDNFLNTVLGVYGELGLNNNKNYPDFMFCLATSEKHTESNIMLQNILDKKQLLYTIAENDGAFYGPKIEIHIRDHNNKYWQCGTIQVDKQLSQRLGVTYKDTEDNEQYPIVLHRAILGSIERFLGIFLETYELPFKLHPVQILICSVNQTHIKQVSLYQEKLSKFNVETDCSNESINKKIRIGTQRKIPYILVVGDKEMESNIVTMRYKNQVIETNIDNFIKNLDQKP